MKDKFDVQDDKRREHRTPTLGISAYLWPLTDVLEPLFKGLVYNVSSKGAAVFSSDPFETGAKIRIASNAISGSPRDARVQWCSHIRGNLYKVGLSLN